MQAILWLIAQKQKDLKMMRRVDATASSINTNDRQLEALQEVRAIAELYESSSNGLEEWEAASYIIASAEEIAQMGALNDRDAEKANYIADLMMDGGPLSKAEVKRLNKMELKF
jgi:hypothetical protein